MGVVEGAGLMLAGGNARWAQLGPLVAELLASESKDRARRLDELRALDPAVAADIDALLSTMSGAAHEVPVDRVAPLPDASLAGQVVGAYTIERELGQGGMGSVWLARRSDGRFDGHVAIKFLNAGLASRVGRERFAREGSILARLAHPNIARMLDAGVANDGGQPYLVLEYIDGLPIKRYCEDNALGLRARVMLFLDVLAAVSHAHNRLILHRDLKPSNILVTAAGEVKLLDFGIAKLLDDATVATAATELTQAAGRAFTLQYAAPEQLRDGDVSTATDVYSLGVLLYVLLGGAHPTARGTVAPIDQMRAVIETEPKRLSDAALRDGAAGSAAARLKHSRALRGDLDNIVAKALKKAPAERYANAGLLADDLRRYLHDEPVTARPDAVGYRLAKFVRRHRLGVAASAVVVAALGVGIGVASWEAKEAQRQRVQAEGLIEFMLGDLRKKLQPVGRLDVLDAVGEKALDYYGAQAIGRLDADSLGRRARALHLIGEITERRGSLDEATRVFQRAADSTAELMARAPNDAQRIFDHAQSVYWVGYIARRRGRGDEAEAAFVRYQALAQQLTRLDPENLDWRIETVYAGMNLGVLYLESSRVALALTAFVAAQQAWAGIVARRPEYGFELARAWGWVAKAHEASGAFDDAIDAQRAKVRVLRDLPDAKENRDVQQLLANGSYELGRLQLALGRLAPAEQSARKALEQIEALVAVDSANTEWLAHMVFARVSLVEIQVASGESDTARGNLERAATEAARLLATDTKRNKWNITLAGSLLLQRLALADPRAPLRGDLESFLSGVAGAASRGEALDAEQVCIASAVELALGDLLVLDARPDNARDHWRAAAVRLRVPAAAGALPALTLLGHSQLRLGHAQDARELAARIEASSYRHPAYADLRQRLAAAAGAAPAHP
ncbi:MAG: serine/threonine-protein kinase [Burkholderiales bacterium]